MWRPLRTPKGYLVRVATRLAIDRLRSARVRRESYVGSWLPEPILTDVDAEQNALLKESVSTAMLLVLETLSPVERAVFVLSEAFGYGHHEIAHFGSGITTSPPGPSSSALRWPRWPST